MFVEGKTRCLPDVGRALVSVFKSLSGETSAHEVAVFSGAECDFHATLVESPGEMGKLMFVFGEEDEWDIVFDMHAEGPSTYDVGSDGHLLGPERMTRDLRAIASVDTCVEVCGSWGHAPEQEVLLAELLAAWHHARD